MRLWTTNLRLAGFNNSVPAKKELLVKGGPWGTRLSSLRLWNGVLSRLCHVGTRPGAQQVVCGISGSNELRVSTPDRKWHMDSTSYA